MEPQKSVSKSTFYMVVLLFLFLFFALIGTFVLITVFVIIPEYDDDDSVAKGSDTEAALDTQDSEANDLDAKDSTDSLDYYKFSGDYVAAELPEGWEIIEYVDGAGTDMFVNAGNVRGLTALEVYNSDADMLFKLEAVSGIGGAAPCDPIFSFVDTDPTYISDESDYVAEYNSAIVIGDTVTLTVQDLSENYSEFNLFDQNVRRIKHDLYFDNNASSMYFDPACKIDSAFREVYELGFTHDGLIGSSYTYTFELNQSATESDLLLLDEVLDSLTTI